jgi:hypothetical protein
MKGATVEIPQGFPLNSFYLRGRLINDLDLKTFEEISNGARARRAKANTGTYEVLSFVIRKEALQCPLTEFGILEPTATSYSKTRQSSWKEPLSSNIIEDDRSVLAPITESEGKVLYSLMMASARRRLPVSFGAQNVRFAHTDRPGSIQGPKQDRLVCPAKVQRSPELSWVN